MNSRCSNPRCEVRLPLTSPAQVPFEEDFLTFELQIQRKRNVPCSESSCPVDYHDEISDVWQLCFCSWHCMMDILQTLRHDVNATVREAQQDEGNDDASQPQISGSPTH